MEEYSACAHKPLKWAPKSRRLGARKVKRCRGNGYHLVCTFSKKDILLFVGWWFVRFQAGSTLSSGLVHGFETEVGTGYCRVKIERKGRANISSESLLLQSSRIFLKAYAAKISPAAIAKMVQKGCGKGDGECEDAGRLVG